MADPQKIIRDACSRQQAFFVELSQIALTDTTLEALFELIVRGVRDIYQADLCHILESDPKSEKLLLRAGTGWEDNPAVENRLDGSPGTQARLTLVSQGPVVIDELRYEQRFQSDRYLVDNGIQSGVSVIIKGFESPYGLLEVFSIEPHHFSLEDGNFLQTTANLLASFIRRNTIENVLRNLNTSLKAQQLAQLGSWEWDFADEKASWAQEVLDFIGLLENVLSQSKVILWSIDREGKLRLSRRGGLTALGVPTGNWLGINVFDILPANHSLAKYFHQAISGTAVYTDYKIGDRTYDLRILPQIDPKGEITGVNGIAFDITQRLETEQALMKTEQSFRMVVDNVQDYAIFSLDSFGYVMSWSEGARQVEGYQAQEIIGKHYSNFFTAEDRQNGLPQKILQMAQQQNNFEGEGWRVRKDGTRFWANSVLNPIKDEKGELQGFTKVVRDFTRRREAEQALQESEKRFRSIFESGAMGIALLGLDGNFLLTNPSLQKMLGYPEHEMLSQGLASLTYPIDLAAIMEMYLEITTGKNDLYRREGRFQRKDKQIVWVSFTASLVRDAQGTPAFVIGMFEDITYRKKMENELREIKRQTIIDQEKQRQYLAQELHDDPMQELYGVLFQLETVDDAISPNEMQTQLKSAKESVEKVIQKLRVVCGELRPVSLAPFGLEGAIREHMDKFKEDYPNLEVKLDLRYDGQILTEEVRISLFRIYQQTLGNVIRHAQARKIVVRFDYDDQQAILEVEDDGIGFDVPPSWLRLARQDHLGIAGALERAELLGGKLKVRSKPGKGTVVQAVVPLQPFLDPAMNDRNFGLLDDNQDF